MQTPDSLHRIQIGTGGNAAAEFALVFPLMLLFIFGLIGFGQALWTQGTLNYAVQTAVRCVQTDTSATTPCPIGSIGTYVAANAPGLDSTQLHVPPPVANTNCGSTGMQVSATYPFTFTIPGVSIPMFNMSAQACFP